MDEEVDNCGRASKSSSCGPLYPRYASGVQHEQVKEGVMPDNRYQKSIDRKFRYEYKLELGVEV